MAREQRDWKYLGPWKVNSTKNVVSSLKSNLRD